MSWEPSATIETLKARAEIIRQLRGFFHSKGYLEVETPAISRYGVTDPHIASIPVTYNQENHPCYLQSSPEYFMKRLLAAGSGPIFQICKAFRDGEQGNQHNPEFTMLEWYQPGFNHHDLMHEIDLLLQSIFDFPPSEKKSYQRIFEKHLNINPHDCSTDEIKKIVSQHTSFSDTQSIDRTTCLELLMSSVIEPQLGIDAPTFIYDFPQEQAALAKIDYSQPTPTAQRFELYIHGKEIANGFHELNHAAEQKQRFQTDQNKRQALEKANMEIDSDFIACLDTLPDCSGVAMGVDRLVQILLGKDQIKQVISFA